MSQLRAEHIHVSMGHRDILADVSVAFSSGLHYLIGLNGSGKTTLLRCLQGLQRYKGRVALGALDLSTLSPKERAREIAVVKQHLNIPFQVTVYDFVLMGRFPYLNWLGNYQNSDREIVAGQLARMEITHLSDRFLTQISGGELQKVMLARALCQQTPLLLLDEPAQSLDPRNKRVLYQQLEDLAAQGETVICATHDLYPLSNPKAHVVGLRSGRIVLDHQGGVDPEEILEMVYGMKE